MPSPQGERAQSLAGRSVFLPQWPQLSPSFRGLREWRFASEIDDLERGADALGGAVLETDHGIDGNVAFAAVDRKLLEASWCLGISRGATFRRVLAPLALPGIATGAILSFAHTMGEFGVVLMVGGNIAGVTRTVSISIYDQVQSLNYAAAAWNSTFLLLVSFAILSVTYLLQRHFRIA